MYQGIIKYNGKVITKTVAVHEESHAMQIAHVKVEEAYRALLIGYPKTKANKFSVSIVEVGS